MNDDRRYVPDTGATFEVLCDDDSSNDGMPALICRVHKEDSILSDETSYMPLLIRRSDSVSSDENDDAVYLMGLSDGSSET